MNVTEDHEVAQPARGEAGRVTLLAFYVTGLLLVLLSLFTIWDRTLTNWLDGNGFTPISHRQSEPAVWQAPASFTIVTLPGEEARR